MTKETQVSSYVAGEYSCDGDGRRIKRKVGGVETWQVYGIGGELIAEYAAGASYLSPQKEYGYRNGQLLITATVSSGGWGAEPSYTGPDPLSTGDQMKLENLTEPSYLRALGQARRVFGAVYLDELVELREQMLEIADPSFTISAQR
jgi:hypothetical protein